ncbi:hypothetical protein NE237_027798 [Protea cynaroides]|uniref:Uncharacterized protein n=1 Tax=Protea cynaroides TaxID=273540 RepID=A0A9Q0GPZ9_9MAGN|nr:hypothetical protein NE237_027798 [Protea cynaroides]
MESSSMKSCSALTDREQSFNGSLRRSWSQRRSKETEVDVRIIDDEVNIKLVQRKKMNNCLLLVSKVLDELQIELLHVSGGKIGDHYCLLFNTKICEGSSVYASEMAKKLIEFLTMADWQGLKQVMQIMLVALAVVAFVTSFTMGSFQMMLVVYPVNSKEKPPNSTIMNGGLYEDEDEDGRKFENFVLECKTKKRTYTFAAERQRRERIIEQYRALWHWFQILEIMTGPQLLKMQMSTSKSC